ncbi:MAG: hypothetical protein D6707_05810 [Bacteroidetes bacterium]|nr:MAG: hypothetical protein D6707_05810 [Bacteroidota bacterium]
MLSVVTAHSFFKLHAQQLTQSLNYLYAFDYEYKSALREEGIHSAFKPLLQSKTDTQLTRFKPRKRWIARKLFTENFIKIDTGDFYLTIDPLFNLQYYQFQDNTTGYLNGRGLRAQGHIGTRFSFYTDFFENQAFFPDYLSRYVTSYGVVPGFGRVKPFKDNGFDYAMASGYISYTPSNHFNFIFGHGKMFIGEGYRSMLISDNAFNYPYLRTTAYAWKNKIQYSWVIAKLLNLNRLSYYNSAENPFIPKNMSLHYLSFKPNPYMEIGLFENTIWQTWDSSGSKPFNFQWVNPLIGIDALTNTLTSANNTVLGLNYKINLLKGWVLYGQFVVDDDVQHAEGYQLGTKYLWKSGKNKVRFQYEFNKSYNGLYQYGSNTNQNYWHYNQPLGFSLGSDVSEQIWAFTYQRQRLLFFVKQHFIQHQGKDIYGNIELGQMPGNVNFTEILAGYLINPATNLTLEAGLVTRNSADINNMTDNQRIVQIKLKTEIFNQYFDF